MERASAFLGRCDWRLGLGTYRLGPKTEHAIKTALNIGYRHIDTASLYGNEEAVASAIASSGVPRSEICVTTKIGVRDIDRLRIREATEAALARLGEIDVLLLHNWRPNAPEAWLHLQDEAKAGRVRAIGVSNFGANDLARLEGLTPAVNQIELSPFLPRTSLLTTCAALGIPVAGHSPLVKGERFSDIKAATGMDNPASALIAWSMARAAAVLARSCDAEHLRENFDAQFFRPTDSHLEALDALEDGYATHPKAVR